MSKARPIWQELPDHFKRSAVGFLDYKSRCRLRLCSRDDLELVDSCPIFLNYVEVRSPQWQDARSTIVIRNGTTSSNLDLTYSQPADCIVDFISLFRHKSSEMSKVVFHGQNYTEFIAQLLRTLGARKLRAAEARWSYISLSTLNYVRLLESFDSRVLRKFYAFALPHQSVREVFALEQWRNLLDANILSPVYTEIDHFLHLHKLKVQLLRIDAHDCWKLIQAFTTRNLPRHSYFQVSSQHDIQLAELLEIFEKYSISPRNQPISDRALHTQKFQVSGGNLNLVVEIGKLSICGAICDVQEEQRDFQRFLDI